MKEISYKKILLKNAKIYDGTASPAFIGDVLLEDDRIIEVAPSIEADSECEITDLQGLSLAPGFIDAHSHNDWFALRKDSGKYFAPFIKQGITTFVSGNCGLSATGFADSTPHKDIIGGGLFFFKDGAPKGQVKDFLEAADRNMPCNLAVLAGHCTARASASGSTSNKLTADEEKEMLDTLFEAPVMKGLPKEHIVEIGGEIAKTFHKRCISVAGEVVPYGDLQFIRLSEFSGSVSEICVLAHECLHVAEWMLRNMAIKEQENRTSELLAYTQEYILKTLLMALYEVNGYDLSGDEDKIG